MRRYLGASFFHDTEPEPKPAGTKPKTEDRAEQREDTAD
jgi:hypothetical protein